MKKTAAPSSSLAAPILDWFDLAGRKDLPWQHDTTPYRVWVSEIMLQQTQVKTVIPYFQRFVDSFADVDALAAASEDQVLHHWSGLGYYSRARNLHKTAKIVAGTLHSQFPSDIDTLCELPGIGRSTAGAIRAIAFGQWAAILDGNVKRVLARYYGIEGWPGQSAVAKRLWQLAEHNTPSDRVADYTQAVMDLGATVCTRSRANCATCPLRDGCIANARDRVAMLPGKKPKRALPIRQSIMLLISNAGGELLLEKRPPSGIWGGLWSLPEMPNCDTDDRHQRSHEIAEHACELALTPNIDTIKTDVSTLRHSFSHYHLDILPVLCRLSGAPSASNTIASCDRYRWYNPANPDALGMAAPIRTLIDRFTTEEPMVNSGRHSSSQIAR